MAKRANAKNEAPIAAALDRYFGLAQQGTDVRTEFSGWTIRTFPGGHVAQQEDPRGVATLIEQSVSDRNSIKGNAN